MGSTKQDTRRRPYCLRKRPHVPTPPAFIDLDAREESDLPEGSVPSVMVIDSTGVVTSSVTPKRELPEGGFSVSEAGGPSRKLARSPSLPRFEVGGSSRMGVESPANPAGVESEYASDYDPPSPPLPARGIADGSDQGSGEQVHTPVDYSAGPGERGTEIRSPPRRGEVNVRCTLDHARFSLQEGLRFVEEAQAGLHLHDATVVSSATNPLEEDIRAKRDHITDLYRQLFEKDMEIRDLRRSLDEVLGRGRSAHKSDRDQ